jgi:hypothetical protein
MILEYKFSVINEYEETLTKDNHTYSHTPHRASQVNEVGLNIHLW